MISISWHFRRFIRYGVLRLFPWLREEVLATAAGHGDSGTHANLQRREECFTKARRLLREAQRCLDIRLLAQAAVSCRAALDCSLDAFLSGKARRLGVSTRLYLVGPRHDRFSCRICDRLCHLTRRVGNEGAHGRHPSQEQVRHYLHLVTWLLRRLERLPENQLATAA